MTLYISGPMSGVEDFNFPLFARVTDLLRAQGHTVASPHEKGGEGEAGVDAWRRYLREDIRLLMDADAIVLLPGWPSSKGARLELHIANELGMPVLTWNDVRGASPA